MPWSNGWDKKPLLREELVAQSGIRYLDLDTPEAYSPTVFTFIESSIFYIVRYRPNEFWMLTLYAKAKREDVPAHILKQLLEVFRDE
jgi:hypothetical protein